MVSKNIPVLLVTANVGSIFEDPSVMLKIWTEEFLSTVAKLDPKFIALHCQEVGGKNYEKSMKYVEDFVKLLMTSEELRLFDRVRVYIDEDYSSAENFTALGNIYFVHESVEDVFIWDFKDMEFVQMQGTEINTGNIEAIVTKEKAKFPQDFFPECKWSRKGFLRTRWSINGTVFDLINIHLFHDASNFIAMESFPSVYCKNRRRALEHTLQRFHNDRYGTAPFFVFGDFNFRTDTDGVVKKLTEGLTTTKVPHHKTNDYNKLQFHNDDSQLILTVGKKEFNHSEHQDVFLSSDGSWLKTFDRELEAFEHQLFEFPVQFPPSYPFEEKVSGATTYMQTRCPAWCDRVLLSVTAKAIVQDSENIEYNVIGRETCMGDHKPVYLYATLRSDSGTISCCEHYTQNNACILSPADYNTVCKCCQNYASIEINIVDMSDYISGRNSFVDVDCTLLHEFFTKDMLAHDPYTPESVESHSPLPEKEGAVLCKLDPNATSAALTHSPRKQSVSPRILKSRLENILRTEPELPQLQELRQCKYLGKSQSQQFAKILPESRARCMSESSRKLSKIKLISTDSAQSIHRLQSHHSSSDEDWFEYEEITKDVELIDEVFADASPALPPQQQTIVLNTNEIISNEDQNKNVRKPNRTKNACCRCTIV